MYYKDTVTMTKHFASADAAATVIVDHFSMCVQVTN